MDHTTFALVIEACVSARRLDLVLATVEKMELQGDMSPDRRIYASLITAFGQQGDVGSALGVFQEMRKLLEGFIPDVRTLDSVLDVCFHQPEDLRHVCGVLEQLSEDPMVDLEVYSKDILMQGFDDAFQLGAALVDMEARAKVGCGNTMMCLSRNANILIRS